MYFKNISIVVSAATISQLIPILASPLLTRMYAPDQFGFFAIYTSLASILGVISTGRFEIAAILPKNHRDGFNLSVIAASICFLFSITLLVILLICGEHMANIAGIKVDYFWLYLLPLTVFLSGLYQSMNSFINRKKLFKVISFGRIIQSGSTAIGQVSFGQLFSGIHLITGQLIGQTISIGYYLRKTMPAIKVQCYSNNFPVRLIALARRYRDFLKLDGPTALLNITANQSPNIILAYLYSPSIAGFYYLTQRVLQIPITVISSSVLEVFKGEAARRYRLSGNCSEIFNKTFKVLVLLTFLPATILFLFIEDIFIIVFGKEWIEAGSYAKLLLPALSLRFIANPLSFVLYIAEKQKYNLFCMIFLMACVSCSLFFTASPEKAVSYISLSYCLYYSLHIILSYRLSRG